MPPGQRTPARLAAAWIARAARLAASLAFALMVTELVLRIWGPPLLQSQDRSVEELLADSAASTASADAQNVSLRGLVQPSADPRVIYELKPGVHAMFFGASVRINEQGYRGPAHPRVKAPGTFRILGIGDSILFGRGVEDHQTALALFEQKLNGPGAQRPYEVLNLAVPGYSTSIEAAQLEATGLGLAPDLVLVCFVPNDDQLPSFIEDPDGGLLASSRVYQLLGLGKRALTVSLRRDAENFWGDPQRVPRKYASMVGPGSVRRGLQRMAELARQQHFELCLLPYGTTHPWIVRARRWCAELGIRTLDLPSYLQRQGLQFQDLWSGPQDPHLSVRGNQVLAQFLADELLKSTH